MSRILCALTSLIGIVTGMHGVAAAFDLSADGRLLAVERGHGIQVLDGKTGCVLQDLGEGLLPLWSPSGNRLAFYSNRSGELQLWTWSTGSGRVRQLTDLAGGVDADPTTRVRGYVTDTFRYSWSPDGTRIVFASRVGRPAAPQTREGAPLILTNTTPPGLTLYGVFAQPSSNGGVVEAKDGRSLGYRSMNKGEVLFNQLFIADVHRRTVTQLTSGSRSFFYPAWSPDARTIVFAATGVGERDADSAGGDAITDRSKDGEIIVLDMITRQQRVLATGPGLKYRPKYSRDGSKITWLASATRFDDPKIHVGRLADGEELTGFQLDRTIADYDWAGASDNGFLIQYYDRAVKLARFPSGMHSVSAITPDASISANMAVSANVWSQARDGLIAWLEGSSGRQRVWLLPAGATQPVQLIEFDPVADRSAEMLNVGRIETLEWRNAHGDELYGTLLYPPDYQSGKRYPLIVDAYPLGGGNQWMNPMNGNHTWASAGYFVFKPMPRSPHVWMNCSRSPDFCRASKGPDAWDVMVDDVISGVDALASRGIIDPERMCLYGHSNGATTVNYLVTRTDRFKCAVSVASSLSDWVSPVFLNTDEWVTNIVGVTPSEDPNAYIRLSAVFHVDKVKTPMLLAVGDKDGDFLLGTIRMYNALRQAGAEVTLLRYPDQGHLFAGPAMKDFHERLMAFFRRHLGPRGTENFHQDRTPEATEPLPQLRTGGLIGRARGGEKGAGVVVMGVM